MMKRMIVSGGGGGGGGEEEKKKRERAREREVREGGMGQHRLVTTKSMHVV